MDAIVEFMMSNETATPAQTAVVVVSWMSLTIFNMWLLLHPRKPRNGKEA